MISSLETGATFKIVDEASPALAKIAGSLKELQGQIDRTKESFTALAKSSFAGLTSRIDKLAGSLEKVQGASGEIAGNLDKAMLSVSGSIDAVGNSIGGLAARINALNAELAATGRGAARSAERALVADAGGLLGGPAGSGTPLPGWKGASGGPGGGRSGMFHARGHMGVPGGALGLAGPGGLAALAGTVMVGWGIDDEMKVEDQAAMSAYISQDPWAKANGAEAIKQYRDIATSAALKGSANPVDVAIAMHRASNLLVGTMDYKKMMGLEQQVLPYAIGEARAKGLSVEETMPAMIEGIHQAGIYDPAGVESFMKDFQFAGAVTPVTMPTFVRALGYSQAQLRAMGISDSETAILATAALQRAGITNTKSGTWLRNYYQTLLPNGKDKHDAALQEMGLIDDKGNATWHATKADGTEDYRQELLNQSRILNTFTDKEKALGDTGKETINRDIQDAFGKQGGSFAAILGDDAFRQQIGNLSGALTGYKGGDEMLGWLKKNDPMFQAQETWREFQKVLMDLGQGVMPAVLTTLKSIDALLHVLDPVLSGLAKVIGVVVGTPTAPPKGGGGSLNPLKNGFVPPWLGGQATPESWDGSTAGLLHKIAYSDGGSLSDGVFRSGGDASGGPIMVAQNVDLLAGNVNLANAGGGGGFGGGFMKASYETGGGFDGGGLHSGGGYTVLGGGGGSGSIAGMSAADLDAMAAAGNFPDSAAGRAAFIRYNAMKMGIDPDYVLRVAKSEGLFGVGPLHQNAQGYNVFGDFQLNYSRGVGVAARNAGIDPSDWKRSDLFAMNWMKVHGMNDWLASGHSGPVPLYHGVDHDKVMASPVSGLKSGEYISHDSAGRRIAVGANGYAIRYLDAATSPSVAEAYPDSDFSHRSHSVHAASLNAASSSGADLHAEIHVHSILDGKHVATAVQKHIVRRNRQVMGASKHDGMGNLTPVDSGYQWER